MKRIPCRLKEAIQGVWLAILVSLALFLSCNGGSPCSISLALQLLHISKEAEVKLFGRFPDVNRYARMIDSLAMILQSRIQGNASLHKKIEIINHLLFQEWGLQADDQNSGIENLCLNRIMDQKQGACLGIVGLYLSVSDDLNLPLSGVLLPGHVFLRLCTPTDTVNIETLRNGIHRTNAFYRQKFGPPADVPHYFRNLTQDEVVGLFFFNLANAYRYRGMLEQAENRYQEALRKFPQLAEARENLQKLHFLIY